MALFIVVYTGSAADLHFYKCFYRNLTKDSIPARNATRQLLKNQQNPGDTLKPGSVLRNKLTDSNTSFQKQKIDTFDFKISKDSLDAPVYYHADDSMVMDVPAKKITLYGKESNTKYLDNELSAPGISFDQKNNVVTAVYKKDSTGKVIASPTFKQGDLLTVSDSIAFNMKSGKGLTKGTYTQQGEMYVYGEKIKKIDANVFYAYKARLTTCNLDTPHFAFVSKKIKFVNNKFAVTGPVHPEFEGVPIPIVLPFGIYPMYQGRHSGLIAPAFTSNAQFGLALEGLGYYKVLNDNWDVVAKGTLYSYGGWTMQVSPRYYKRYHYQGNFMVDFQKTKFNFKGDPDYAVINTFKIRWNHSADSKARPGVTFSANVDAGSTKFNQYVPNSPLRNFNNILTSTINYSKVWKDKPFNVSVIANHQQNTNLKTMSITLPDLSFNMNTLYPFRRKESAGNLKWYENIGVALNTNAKNQTTLSDDTSVDKRSAITQLKSNMQWAATHNVPISLSLPPLGPLQVSPGITYSERWYQQKTIYSWDSTSKKLDTNIRKGFYTARDMSFSMGMSTRIFGMIGFKKTSKIQAIRHEIRPQLSASYTPDMNGRFYYNTQIDSLGNYSRFSVYRNNLTPVYPEGKFGGLSFGIDNNIQMKVRDSKDTTEGATKKVSLIDGLSINGGYNFLVDSFQLSYLNLSARSNLFNKISISANVLLEPYQNDTTGRRINRLVWKDKIFTLGRMTSGNISISSNFQGGDKAKADQKKQSLRNGVNPYSGQPLNDEQAEAAYISNNPAEYTDFSIPWTLNFGYSLRFFQVFDRTQHQYNTQFNSDVNLGGTIRLTEKWQLGLTGIYNFTTKEIGVVSLSIAREMHCWQMSINVSPIGRNRFFNITISPKSALLRDIKVNRTRYFYDL